MDISYLFLCTTKYLQCKRRIRTGLFFPDLIYNGLTYIIPEKSLSKGKIVDQYRVSESEVPFPIEKAKYPGKYFVGEPFWELPFMKVIFIEADDLFIGEKKNVFNAILGL